MKINRIETYGWEAAVRGMRNPMNSWGNSDSYWCKDEDKCPFSDSFWCDGKDGCPFGECDLEKRYKLGENDLKLMKNLIKAGTDHSKFMRMIIFSCDIEAPLYWWKEMDTYKVGTVRNSCSTMHKLTSKPFEEKDFENHYGGKVFDQTLEFLNDTRENYLKATDEKEKQTLFELMVKTLPSSYIQKATWIANYAVLRSIYHSRKNHKLKEWRFFTKVIEDIPYAKELIVD